MQCHITFLGFVAAASILYEDGLDPSNLGNAALFIIIPYVFRYILTGNTHCVPFDESK